MKKIFSFLGSISLISFSSLTVVACQHPDNRKNASDYVDTLNIGKIDALDTKSIINKFLASNKRLVVGPIDEIQCSIRSFDSATIDCLHTNYWKKFSFNITFEWVLKDNYDFNSNNLINISKDRDKDSVSWEFDNLRYDYNNISSDGKFNISLNSENQENIVYVPDEDISLVLNNDKTKYILTFSWEKDQKLNPLINNTELRLYFDTTDPYGGEPFHHDFIVISN